MWIQKSHFLLPCCDLRSRCKITWLIMKELVTSFKLIPFLCYIEFDSIKAKGSRNEVFIKNLYDQVIKSTKLYIYIYMFDAAFWKPDIHRCALLDDLDINNDDTWWVAIQHEKIRERSLVQENQKNQLRTKDTFDWSPKYRYGHGRARLVTLK